MVGLNPLLRGWGEPYKRVHVRQLFRGPTSLTLAVYQVTATMRGGRFHRPRRNPSTRYRPTMTPEEQVISALPAL